MNRFYNKLKKIVASVFLAITGFILLVLLIIIIFFALPGTGKRIAGMAEKFIGDRTGAEMKIGSIEYYFPDGVVIKDFFIEDDKKDTLLSFRDLEVNIGLMNLIRKEIRADRIELSGATVNITKYSPDSSFNFSYLLNSFSSEIRIPEESKVEKERKFRFSAGKILLGNIHFTYADSSTRNIYSAKIGEFRTKLHHVDVDSMKFEVGDTYIERAGGKIWIRSSGPSDPDTSSALPDINLTGMLRVSDFSFAMMNEVSGQDMELVNFSTEISSNHINLPSKYISLEFLDIQRADVSMNSTSNPNTIDEGKDTAEKPAVPDIDWSIYADEINISNVSFSKDVIDMPSEGSGFDPNHIHITGFSTKFRDISLSPSGFKADLRELTLKTGDNFVVGDARMLVSVTDTSLVITDFYLATPLSRIILSSALKYNQLDDIVNDWQKLPLILNISEISIGAGDAYYFAPFLSDYNQVFSGTNRNIFIKGKVHGKFEDLLLDHLVLTLGNTHLEANARIKGLPEVQNAFFQADIRKFETTDRNIMAFLSDTLLPETIKLPPEIAVSGIVKGRMGDLMADIRVSSTYGEIAGEVRMTETIADSLSYITGKLGIANFDLGTLVSQPDKIGRISVNTSVEGFLSDSLTDLSLRVGIPYVELAGYTYHDISFEGYLIDKNIGGTLLVSDTNIQFILHADLDFTDSVPLSDVVLNMKGIDLQALNLSKEPLRGRGMLKLSLRGGELKDLEGDMSIQELLIVKGQESYRTGEITASLNSVNNTITGKLTSDIVSADYVGSVYLADLGKVIFGHLNRYFTINPELQELEVPQKFDLTVDIHNSELITEVLWPQLSSFMPARLESRFDSDRSEFILEGSLPRIVFDNYALDSLNFFVRSDKNRIQYDLGIESFSAEPFVIGRTIAEGSIGNDSIAVSFFMEDDTDQNKYLINAEIVKDTSGFMIGFRQDSVILNYRAFSVPQTNSLTFSDKKLEITDIILMSDNQSIEVVPVASNQTDNHYSVIFRNFEISNISGLVQDKEDIINGMISGNLDIVNLDSGVAFNTDLKIDTLSLFGEPVFSLVSITTSQDDNSLNFDINTNGYGNDLTLKGVVPAKSETEVPELDIRIGSLQLNKFQPFLRDQVNTLDGIIDGSLSVVLSGDFPEITGKVHFNGLEVEPVILGTGLRAEDETIEFTGRQIALNNFTILDQQGNRMLLNGKLQLDDISDPSFDFKINSRDFSFLNKKEAGDQDLFYGSLVGGLDATIKGTMNSPEVSMTVVIGDGTDLKIIVPGFSTASIEQEGLVEFVKRDSSAQDIITRNTNNEDTLIIAGNSDLDLTVNLDLRKEAKLTVIIDPVAREQLAIQGTANLSLELLPGKNVSLTGSYEIEEGLYNLSFYNVIRRQFTIARGGTLLWKGNPLDAVANLSAIYEVRTSPLPLIAEETAGMTTGNYNNYRRLMPFQVFLNVRGELLQPEINFNLKMPESQRDAVIQAKLDQLNQNETELHKQVFSLLLLNSFSSTSSTSEDVSVGQGISASARSSISNLLTNQLSQLSNRLVKGVDIELAVDSYYENRTDPESARTEVDLKVSKTFFNDRLNVKVGGDFRVEGEQEERADEVSSIAGDIMIEYKLEESGRYRMSAFNRREYEGILEGEVTKTGISLIYNRDFYKIRELFSTEKAIQNPDFID